MNSSAVNNCTKPTLNFELADCSSMQSSKSEQKIGVSQSSFNTVLEVRACFDWPINEDLVRSWP